MQIPENISRLIIQRLAGTISDEDSRELIRWMNQDEANKTAYNEVIEIWAHSGTRQPHPEPATDTEWSKLKDRINTPTGKVRKFMPWHITAAAAASIITAIILIGLLSNREPSSKITTLTSLDQVRQFRLPDSTAIWLNTHSSLSYSEKFDTTNRTVTLKGEAFFDISHTWLQFVINTVHGNVVVMGTSFNINTSDSVTTTSVLSGTVAIQHKNGENTTLTAGEVGTAGANSLQKKSSPDLNFAAWRTHNNPVYDNEAATPARFIQVKSSWKKNQVNQSVIEGVLTNTATLAAYEDIALRITFTKPNGKTVVTRFYVTETIQPGQHFPFRKKLLDIFTKTTAVKVDVEHASTR